MKMITIDQVRATKREAIRHYLAGAAYPESSACVQYVQYIDNLSDEDFMNSHNEVARRQALADARAAEKRAEISAERKSTGISKKSYRAEYDRLNALYKSGDQSVKAEMKRIQKFAF